MIVYSKKIIEFVREINRVVTHILLSEIRLKVGRSRFYNREQKLSYPINIVIYNNKPQLGYFDSNFYELGFHERLMHAPQKQLHDVIRHEIAHYMIFIEYGQTVQPHSPQFRSFCKSLGWGEEVYRSTTCPRRTGPRKQCLLRKVQKLMALATSSSTHEAEQAMIKSQQLFLKHNVDSTHLGEADDEQVLLNASWARKGKMPKCSHWADPRIIFCKYRLSSGGRLYLPRNFGKCSERRNCRICGSRSQWGAGQFI